jgi:hypothetical protein
MRVLLICSQAYLGVAMHRLPAESSMAAISSGPIRRWFKLNRRQAPKVTEQTARGGQMHALVERLYPMCRSITGDGVRTTLDVLAESIPLTAHEVPTGTPVLDWTVPKEWNIPDAYVADPEGGG